MAFFILRSFCINASKSIIGKRNIHSSKILNNIAEGGLGTHKPSPFQERVLVWTKTYKSAGEIPKRVTRSQMKNAMDKFRVQVSIVMVGVTFVTAAIFAMIGRKERMEGKTLTKISSIKKD